MNIPELLLRRFEAAELREIDQKRCFIVSREVFAEIVSNLYQAGWEVIGDSGFTRRYKMESINISVSSADEPRYLICTPALPLLDDLWDKKFKGDKK